MKGFIFTAAIIATTTMLYSCHKSDNNNAAPAATVTHTNTPLTDSGMLVDFVNVIALPQYQNLQTEAQALNTAITNLNASPTAANLAAARQAWRNTRTGWETCEGFLFGPVEENLYDPDMDTWPTSFVQIDSMLASNTTFTVATIQQQGQTSLRGFHPLEFILWGVTGAATVDSITANEKQYMVALSQDILNTVNNLNTSWATTGGNFQQQVLQAGVGSTSYTSRKSALLAIVGAMSDICGEVGQASTDGKMYDPFTARDSTLTESPFSHNSLIDFRNNIIGAQNVYLCTYNNITGASLSNYIATKNLSLDNTIKNDFTAAISALNNITGNFETAIFTQRTQIQNAMTALQTLQNDISGGQTASLTTFINTYVTD